LSSVTPANPLERPADRILFKVVVTNAGGSTDSATVQVNILPPFTANAGADRSMVQGDQLTLKPEYSGSDITWKWSPDYFINDVNALQPTINPSFDTAYVFTVTSNYGCGQVSDTMHVKVYKRIVIPNAFSPNSDGVNDAWLIPALEAYNNYRLTVFNRFGQPVFTTSRFVAWDGSYKGNKLPVGNYYYLIELNTQQQSLSGSVTIIR